MRLKNEIYEGANGKLSLIDLSLPADSPTQSIVLFVHGYKGYKDWGCWNLVEHFFTSQGIGFCKINLSHNGGSLDEPIDFPDLDSFGLNRYTYEIEDIKQAIDWVQRQVDLTNKKLYLIGHSRGGGDAVLAGEDERVSGVITWASICDIASRFPKGEELKKWEESGVRYIENGRTKQKMPHFYTFYQDWFYNKELLSIENAAKTLDKPCLHIHGKQDETVSMEESKVLCSWTEGKLIILDGTNHTFDSKHPWDSNVLPEKLYEVCHQTIDFIRSLK